MRARGRGYHPPVTEPTPHDPEVARIEALLAAERGGTASEAEREELAIYAAERPELAGRLVENARAAELGAGWLHRVEHDERRLAIERGSRARIERGVGLGLVLVGWLLHFPLPIAGVLLSGGGIVLLLYSLLRVRSRAGHRDPYEDVIR